jgi:L-ascorbate metabolism protein UlaG (beta-lactamase superfamily)
MRIRRLGWAGLEIQAAGATAVVDLLEDASSLAQWIGEPRQPLPSPSAAAVATVALVTHLHADHADPPAIARALAPNGTLLRPPAAHGSGAETAALAAAEAAITKAGVPAQSLEPWQTVSVGPFEITAIPAVDGFGDPQVSWAIAADGRRVLHAGDTTFHGHWWLTAMRHGPFDAVFLPVNGALCDFPHRQPASALPAAMDPSQAAVAAALLRARLAIPIHYDTFHRPPTYTQVDDPAGTFLTAAEQAGVAARILDVGAEMEI